MMRPTLALAAVMATLGAGQAHAQTPPAPSELISRGVALREQGDDEHARALFEQAYDVGHGAEAEAQLALAEQALGQWVAAEGHLSAALATSDPWITARRGPLEGALAALREHLGTLEVTGNIPGAVVAVDGATRGTLPLAAPLRVPTGVVTLEVRAVGYYTVTRTVEIRHDAPARESVTLAAQSTGGVTVLACPPGMARNDDTRGQCCWSGQSWSSVRSACVGAPTCPAGLVARDEACVQDPLVARRAAQELLVEVTDEHESLAVEVRVGAARERCAVAVTHASPCRIAGILPGEAELVVSGDWDHEQTITVREGHMKLRIDAIDRSILPITFGVLAGAAAVATVVLGLVMEDGFTSVITWIPMLGLLLPLPALIMMLTLPSHTVTVPGADHAQAGLGVALAGRL